MCDNGVRWLVSRGADNFAARIAGAESGGQSSCTRPAGSQDVPEEGWNETGCLLTHSFIQQSLQCIDTVVWAAVMASGL